MMTNSRSPTERFVALNLDFLPFREPAGTFVHVVRANDLLFLSGHAPIRADGGVVFGRLGDDLDVDAGYAAAREAGIGVLSTLKHELGSLDAVRRVVRVYRVVNATPSFVQHTQVINGASDLFVE